MVTSHKTCGTDVQCKLIYVQYTASANKSNYNQTHNSTTETVCILTKIKTASNQ